MPIYESLLFHSKTEARREYVVRMRWSVVMKFGQGERIQVRQNRLLPNSDFSSDFGHFIFKKVRKSKNVGKYSKSLL